MELHRTVVEFVGGWRVSVVICTIYSVVVVRTGKGKEMYVR